VDALRGAEIKKCKGGNWSLGSGSSLEDQCGYFFGSYPFLALFFYGLLLPGDASFPSGSRKLYSPHQQITEVCNSCKGMKLISASPSLC
jgi:hypothetical protein